MLFMGLGDTLEVVYTEDPKVDASGYLRKGEGHRCAAPDAAGLVVRRGAHVFTLRPTSGFEVAQVRDAGAVMAKAYLVLHRAVVAIDPLPKRGKDDLTIVEAVNALSPDAAWEFATVVKRMAEGDDDPLGETKRPPEQDEKKDEQPEDEAADAEG